MVAPNPSVTPVPAPHHADGLGPLLGRTLSELTRALQAALDRERVDLSLIQVQVLRRLYVMGPTNAVSLARMLAYDGGGMTRVLDQLQQRGLLERQPDPADRRSLRIVLTRAGRECGRKLLALSEQVLDGALAGLTAQERANLVDYLHRMLATLTGAGHEARQ